MTNGSLNNITLHCVMIYGSLPLIPSTQKQERGIKKTERLGEMRSHTWRLNAQIAEPAIALFGVLKTP